MIMLSNFKKTWNNNHGWQLSGASLIVGLVACLIWYMDWVPEVVFSSSTAKPILVSQTLQPQSGIMVAHINGPANSQGKSGRILLYPQESEKDEPPQFQEKFAFDERGMAAILLIVPTAQYTVIAFIDDNDNGQLDFEGDQALESFRLPRSVTGGQNSGGQESGDPESEAKAPVENGVINLQAQTPVLCTFDFSE